MDNLLNSVSSMIRGWMAVPAKILDKLSGGHITPNHVTLLSLLGHITVVWALWQARPILAAILLAFFGLLDSVDGALARLQKTASPLGALYESVSDRLKEVMLYCGIAVYLQMIILFRYNYDWLYRFYDNRNYEPTLLISLPIIVCGLSLIVSYIRARGETVLLAAGKHSSKDVNKIFTGGIARYEIRMALIIVGLLTGTTIFVLHILLLLLVTTALQRLNQVRRALKSV